MKLNKYILFYVFLSLITLSSNAQSPITEVAANESQVVSKRLGVSKTSGDTSCIIVSQNADILDQGQDIVITVKGCHNLEMHDVLIGGFPAEIDENGVAKLTFESEMIGIHNITVAIVYKNKDGKLKSESYTVTYKIRKSSS